MAKNAMPFHWRTQVDHHTDELAEVTGLACPEDEDRTRQEFAEEADVNVLLRRYGAVPMGEATYGEFDYDVHLHQAVNGVRQARDDYRRMPAEVRNQFPTFEAFMAAVEDGRLEITTEPAVKQPEPPVEQPDKPKEG